jgi:hypothetical protein
MKKIFLLTVSILMVTLAFAKAGNPIPSYNVPVSNKDYFMEGTSTLNGYAPCDEKRDMNVSNDTPGSNPILAGGFSTSKGNIAVFVYRLDMSITLGPFIIAPGQTLKVRIDGYPWGVSTETNAPGFVSVWTTGGHPEL